MTSSMKPFQFVQRLYQTLGIFSPHPSHIFSINPRKLFVLMGMVVIATSRFGYFLFETTFAQDYGESFYGVIVEAIALFDFIVTVCFMPKISKLFIMYEKFIEQSKEI